MTLTRRWFLAAQNALVANAKLKDELQLQSIGVDNLMHRFTQQAKHFQRMVRLSLKCREF